MMNQKEKENDDLPLNEPKNQIVVPKDCDPPLKPGYDYIWGSDQDDLSEDRDG